eukprot:10314931-Alexandrium_andersonii.AAC.1
MPNVGGLALPSEAAPNPHPGEQQGGAPASIPPIPGSWGGHIGSEVESHQPPPRAERPPAQVAVDGANSENVPGPQQAQAGDSGAASQSVSVRGRSVSTTARSGSMHRSRQLAHSRGGRSGRFRERGHSTHSEHRAS